MSKYASYSDRGDDNDDDDNDGNNRGNVSINERGICAEKGENPSRRMESTKLLSKCKDYNLGGKEKAKYNRKKGKYIVTKRRKRLVKGKKVSGYQGKKK
ncbi:hypothetical protein PMALA_001540 [Plasmodium malariae]|uniref:Uncharacterized protein n=2 Tax=Plasmodium (Plasmodium) TaxID=418103 RepID=A0A1A8VQX9_PLAMA|nr:hypothetical protein PMALA_001540 [Plasmodium malariae]